jgi:nucleotide-binding universal stress UspA family protein
MDRIVVGVDGSESAQEALRWAIDEARRRDASVKVVYAWHQPFMSACGFIGDMDPFKEAAQHLLDAAVNGVDATGVAAVERKLVTGSAAQALIRAAKGAAMLVVGSRGRGGFTGLLLGSVSQHAAHYAPCPVVIIPGGA